MQYHNRTINYIKYILSFFLVLGALFAVSQHRATAYAAGSDRIYYFNMSANGVEGSMILVETDGHWGLMDAGHRYATTIQDSTGRTFSTAVNGLSSQIYCRNGKDVANYMINQLGVTHLDFVVGTHAHSDHVGGIPEVAATSYKDASGQTRYLVDSGTTYYYKEYQHISDLEDDLVQYSSASWHNQAFAYQAAETMRTQGAVLVNVANGRVVTNAEQANFGDYIEFMVGDMTFRLYNLDEQTYSGSENINSIVTVMSNGTHTVVNLADINTNNGAIDKVSAAIAGDIANNPNMAPVDIVVAGHHGYAGSNTKTMFDELQPGFVVVSNGMSNSWLYTDGDLAAAIPYAEGLFGTLFYNTSISPYAVVTDLNGESVYVYSLESNGNLTNAISRMMKASNKTGWASWVNTEGTLWSYLENGKSVRNAWRRVGGKMYHFDNTGIMDTGWYTDAGGTRYLEESGALITGWRKLDGCWYYFENNKGYRVTNAWQRVNGKMYHFDAEGRMQTGWYEDDGGVRYLDDSGALITGWKLLDNTWYYFENNKGYRVTNAWQRVNGKMYHFDAEGRMQTGWYEDDGGVRYLDDSGALITGWRDINGKRYYFEGNKGYKAANSWQRINGKMYYFDDDGSIHTGWLEDDGGVRYLNADGTIAVGWKLLDNTWYYFEGNKGYKVTNAWQRINGKMYHFDAEGRMQTGWYEDDGGVRYLDSNGSIVTGWREIDGNWCYFDSQYGYRQTLTGWHRINGTMHYFDNDGSMHTGWLEDEGGVRYLDAGGALVTGWRQIGDTWYYFESNKGYRVTNAWQRVNGKMYHFDAEGRMQTGWYEDDNGVRYLDSNGNIVTGWQQIDGEWCCFDSQYGYRQTVTGWQQIAGKWYYFYDDGRMARDAWVDGYYVGSDGVWVEGAVPTRTTKAVADNAETMTLEEENSGSNVDNTLVLTTQDRGVDEADNIVDNSANMNGESVNADDVSADVNDESVDDNDGAIEDEAA